MIPASRKLALGFCCEPLEESGYTWSHTTILGDLLITAERKYGARDKSWTILGIEIGGLHPQIWYPRSSEGARFVSVMLSDAARMNPRQAVFQLAHEVIHLLAPLGRRGGLVIEEGLATANSRAESISRQLYMSAGRKLFEGRVPSWRISFAASRRHPATKRDRGVNV
jgi:hypothetical protein